MSLAVLLVALALGSGASGGPADVVRHPIADQHGESHSLAEHRGQVAVAMVVDVAGLRQLKAWEVSLLEELQDLPVLRVAEVPQGRGVTRERVVERLEGRVPPEISILIDMDRLWARAFDLDASDPNLLLFDPEQRLVHLFRGRRTDEMVQRVVAAVRELRGDAGQGRP